MVTRKLTRMIIMEIGLKNKDILINKESNEARIHITFFVYIN